MADVQRWQTLTCPCGSTQFYECFALKRHPQGGMAKDGISQRCTQCHEIADTGAMLRAMQIQRQREQLAALEQELAMEKSLPPSLPISGRV